MCLDAPKCDVDHLLSMPRVGNLSVRFSIGVAAQLLKFAGVSGDVQLGLDDDRRVRVQGSLALIFQGEVDLAIWNILANLERS